MDIRSFGGAVTGGGSGATDLIAVWSSATVINAYSGFSYNGTTFLTTLDMRMNSANTAAAQGIIRNAIDTGSMQFLGGSNTNSGYVTCYGNSHATKPNWVEIGTLSNPYFQLRSSAGIRFLLNFEIQAGAANATIQDTNGDIGTNAQPAVYFKDNTGTIGLVGWNSSTSYDLTFRNFSSVGSFAWMIAATTVGAIDQNGKWFIGASGGTSFHAVRGRGLDITYSTVGTTAYVSLVHSGASGASGAQFYAQVTGGSSGDPALALSVASATDWILGIDNSASDAFVISKSTSLGSNNYFQISTAGVVTIGTGTATTHVINTQLATAGSDALTLGNGPTGKAGDPAVYIQINVNGTNRVVPAW